MFVLNKQQMYYLNELAEKNQGKCGNDYLQAPASTKHHCRPSHHPLRGLALQTIKCKSRECTLLSMFVSQQVFF